MPERPKTYKWRLLKTIHLKCMRRVAERRKRNEGRKKGKDKVRKIQKQKKQMKKKRDRDSTR